MSPLRKLIAAASVLLCASAFGQAGNVNGVFATQWNGINATSINGTKAAPAAPVDAYLNFANQTNGDVVTEAKIAAGSFGTWASDSSKWSKQGSETTSLAFAASANSLYANIVVAGVNYPIGTASKRMGYDSNVGTGTMSMLLGNLPVSTKVITSSFWFTANQNTGGNSAYDIVRQSSNTTTSALTFSDGAFGPYGINLESAASAHSNVQALVKGTPAKITFQSDYNTGFLQGIVQDSTGAILSSGKLAEAASGTLQFFQAGNSEGHTQETGIMYGENYLVDYTNGVSLIGAGTLSTPSPTVTQTYINEVTLTWTSAAYLARIDRSSDGGATWVQQNSAYNYSNNSGTQKYQDTSVSDGSTYIYRVMPICGPVAAAPAVTSGVTVNNANFITANTAVFNTTQYGTKNVPMNGISDSKQMTFDVFLNPDNTGADMNMLGATGGGIFIQLNAARQLHVFGVTTSVTFINFTTVGSVTNGVYTHVHVQIDNATGGATNTKVQFDGVTQNIGTFTPDNINIDFAGVSGVYQVGADGTNTTKFSGTMSEFCFATSIIPDSSFAVQAYNGTWHPISKSGLTLQMYYSTTGSANTWWTDNSGQGNNLTPTGTLGTGTSP